MKGVFKCAMEDDERRSWSVKCSSLGMPMCTPNKYSRRLKRLSLGMPPCIPFFINNYQFVPRCTIFFITSCVMCYAWSVLLFTLSFVSFDLFDVHNKLDPIFLCVGERHAPLKLEHLIRFACFLCCELFFIFS